VPDAEAVRRDQHWTSTTRTAWRRIAAPSPRRAVVAQLLSNASFLRGSTVAGLEHRTLAAQLAQNRIRWPVLQARDFARDPDDPDKFEQYRAEALAHRHVPVSALLAIACQGDLECGRIEEEVKRRDLEVRVVARPRWYFS
jgi:hypothetical protein